MRLIRGLWSLRKDGGSVIVVGVAVNLQSLANEGIDADEFDLHISASEGGPLSVHTLLGINGEVLARMTM